MDKGGLVGYSLWGPKESDMAEYSTHKCTLFIYIEKHLLLKAPFTLTFHFFISEGEPVPSHSRLS